MDFLIDTQCVIWFIEGNENLSIKARNLISDKENRLFVSVASVWEMAIKISVGRLILNFSLEQLLAKIVAEGIVLLNISVAHTLPILNLPHHHKDPFDRIIITQAMIEGLTVITSDGEFKNYPVKVIF